MTACNAARNPGKTNCMLTGFRMYDNFRGAKLQYSRGNFKFVWFYSPNQGYISLI
jgi:hypothetical protein